MRHLDQPAEVEAHFYADGRIIPTSFRAAGERHAVTSVGRSWDVAGEGRHILVQDEAERVVELLLRSADFHWRIVRAGERPMWA